MIIKLIPFNSTGLNSNTNGIKINQNFINGDMNSNNGWYYGSSYTANISYNNNILMFTPRWTGDQLLNSGNSSYINGHIYYVYISYLSSEGKYGIVLPNNTLFTSSLNNYSYCSSANSNNFFIYCNNSQLYPLYLGETMLIDLTLMFGQGFEPTKEWCDEHLSDYIAYNNNPDITESPYDFATG